MAVVRYALLNGRSLGQNAPISECDNNFGYVCGGYPSYMGICLELVKINRVLVIGSGPIVIGQAAEFDYA